MERLKFSSREKPRESAFLKVERQLESLRKLLTQNDEIAELRAVERRRATTRSVRVLLHFWRHAQAIYSLITRSWCCPCQPDHCADLLLLHRTKPEIKLDVDFVFSRDPACLNAKAWKQLRTQIIKNDDNANESKAKVVSFAVSQAQGSSHASVLISSTSSAIALPKKLSPIVDMCQTIAMPQSTQQVLGLLTSADEENRYAVLAGGDPAINTTSLVKAVSLKSLLTGDPVQKPDRKQRYKIALAVASAHLQLHSSGWLEAGWSNANIFFKLDGKSTKHGEPYLRRGFCASSPTGLTAFDVPFATLGILLLELCFGCTLDASPYRQNHLSPDGRTDLVQDREVAWEWSKLVEGETGHEYADAVDWCLGKWRVRKEDLAWREQFYQIVIEGLRKSYEVHWPKIDSN
jgi:hypothetical protein